MYHAKIDNERLQVEKKKKELRDMEAKEAQLLESLKNTQQMQNKAYDQLINVMDVQTKKVKDRLGVDDPYQLQVPRLSRKEANL